MNQQKIASSTPIQQKYEEHILVVKRNTLLAEHSWHGINAENLDHYLTIIKKYKEFFAP